MTQLPPAPRWYLLLPLLAALAWWPGAAAWQSDDWLALERVSDFRNVLADWFGPQFGASDLWWFHRPVVTTSFWVDWVLAGDNPPWFHCTNVLLHAASALLMALAWRRVATDATAFLAGLLWSVSPTHAGAVLWAAGRSDLLATLFTLTSILCLLRTMEGQRHGRTCSLVALALALCSKEVAFAAPALLSAIAFALAPAGERVRTVVRQTAAHWLLFALVLVVRLLAIGRLGGGYSGASHDPVAMAAGLGSVAVQLLSPPNWLPAELWMARPGTESGTGLVALLAPASYLLQAVPLALGLALLFRREAMLAGLALFVLACAPMAGFLSTPEQFHNLRYFHLALGALCGVVACGSRLCALVAAVAWLVFLQPVRAVYESAARESADLRRAVETVVPPQQPQDEMPLLFVAGLPHTTVDGMVLQYHFGVDRVTKGRARLLPLRPAVESQGAYRLFADAAGAFGIPGARTFRAEPHGLMVALDPQDLPAVPLGTVRSFDCSAAALGRIAAGTESPAIHLPGLRRPHYRITVFTAVGCFCLVVPDAPDDGLDALLELKSLFKTAQWGTEPGSNLLIGLQVPTIHDLHTDFPVLVEAGELTPRGFVPSHRARELLTFRFDRELPSFVRAATGGG
ncbi:MAG: hypothetical protein RL148_597 [Planctomycetota bacterium]